MQAYQLSSGPPSPRLRAPPAAPPPPKPPLRLETLSSVFFKSPCPWCAVFPCIHVFAPTDVPLSYKPAGPRGRKCISVYLVASLSPSLPPSLPPSPMSSCSTHIQYQKRIANLPLDPSVRCQYLEIGRHPMRERYQASHQIHP